MSLSDNSLRAGSKKDLKYSLILFVVCLLLKYYCYGITLRRKPNALLRRL
jgi:hypothetical protein